MEAEQVTCGSVKRHTALGLHNHLGQDIAIAAASGDEEVGACCFHKNSTFPKVF